MLGLIKKIIYIYIYMFMRINYIFRYIIVIRLALSYNPWTILYLWRNLSIEMYYVEYWRRNCSAVSQWLLLYQRMQTIYLKKFPIDIVLQWYPLKNVCRTYFKEPGHWLLICRTSFYKHTNYSIGCWNMKNALQFHSNFHWT